MNLLMEEHFKYEFRNSKISHYRYLSKITTNENDTHEVLGSQRELSRSTTVSVIKGFHHPSFDSCVVCYPVYMFSFIKRLLLLSPFFEVKATIGQTNFGKIINNKFFSQ